MRRRSSELDGHRLHPEEYAETQNNLRTAAKLFEMGRSSSGVRFSARWHPTAVFSYQGLADRGIDAFELTEDALKKEAFLPKVGYLVD